MYRFQAVRAPMPAPQTQHTLDPANLPDGPPGGGAA